MIRRSGYPASTDSSPPSHSVKPVDWNAEARERPPPKSTRISHGMERACAQSSTVVRRPSASRVGHRKSSSAAAMATVESPTWGSKVWMPGMVTAPICFGARIIQATAAAAKTTPTTRSAGCQGPSFSRSPRSTPAAPASGTPGRRKSRKQRRAQQATSITAATGRPIAIQRANDTSTSRSSSAIAANTALGGVPMRVATPPIEPA